MGELTNATYQNPTPDQPVGGPYVNDWVGNRTSPPSGADAMVYNDVDQLVAWPGMHGVDANTPGYVYDDNGNLIEVKNAGGTGSVVTYTYDEDSNLLESATYGGHTLTNTWYVFGDRSSVAVNGRTYSFTYNILAGIPAVIEEVDSGTNGKTYYYYRDPGGALIARRDASDPDSLQYYHYDELGSTRIITNKDGQVTDTYAYDAYGSVIAHVGSTTDNPYQYVGALGYYTHYQDPEFKLLQLGFRFYDPETGRFTQQDPAGDGINWYAYCGGNPMAGVDPWGLYPCPEEESGGFGLWDGIQAALDLVGLIPGLGEAADGVNAVISLGRGDLASAGLSLVSMVPVIGDAIGKGGKAVKYADEVADAASAAKKVVYVGRREGKVVYVGITKDLARRQIEHGDRFVIERITDFMPKNRAKAIETAIIERSRDLGLGLENQRRSIGLGNPLYDELLPPARSIVDDIPGWKH